MYKIFLVQIAFWSSNRVYRAWILTFYNQNHKSRGTEKSQTFLPRDLQLSNLGKRNSYFCWLRICKNFRSAVLIKLWLRDDNTFYQFWAIHWTNLNECQGWSVFKSPFPSSHSFISNPEGRGTCYVGVPGDGPFSWVYFLPENCKAGDTFCPKILK